MGLLVARIPFRGPAPRWPAMDHRIRHPIPPQTHPNWRARKPGFKILRRGPLHQPGGARLRSGPIASRAALARGPGFSGESRALFAARTDRNAHRPAAARTAEPKQSARARALNVLLGLCAAPLSPSGPGAGPGYRWQEHDTRRPLAEPGAPPHLAAPTRFGQQPAGAVKDPFASSPRRKVPPLQAPPSKSALMSCGNSLGWP